MDDQFSTFQLREARHQAESSNKSGYYRSVDQKLTTKLPFDSHGRRDLDISIDIEEIDFSYHREQHHSAAWTDGTALLHFISSPTFIRNDTKILGNEGRISSKRRLRDYTKEHRHIEIVVLDFRSFV